LSLASVIYTALVTDNCWTSVLIDHLYVIMQSPLTVFAVNKFKLVYVHMNLVRYICILNFSVGVYVINFFV